MTQKLRKAVFPVAGLGTRLLPATKAIPKELLTVVDRPLIQYAVDEAREVIYVANSLDKTISVVDTSARRTTRFSEIARLGQQVPYLR